MKKTFPILIALFSFGLIIQYITIMMIDEHKVQYSIKHGNKTYMVNESFRYVENESYYDFTVSDNKDLFFVFSFNDEFNKQQEIIEDIEFFTTKDLQCIFPIYKRNKTGNVSCIYQNKQVSYSYLEQINNYDVEVITKSLIDKGYKHKDWEKTKTKASNVTNAPTISVYKDNVLKNYHFIIWNYKGVVLLTNKDVSYRIYLNKDHYDNTNSILVDKYYVTVEEGQGDFDSFLMYNTKEYGKGTIYTKKPLVISRNFYFNGVFNKKLYLTDLTYNNQIEIDPKKEKVVVVGNEQDGFLTVKNNKLVRVESTKFLSDKVFFTNQVKNSKLVEEGAVEIIKENTSFYYITADGGVYRANEDKLYRPVLLFKLNGLTEWKVKDGDIMAVAKDKVYFYNEEVGLRIIAINSELNYNHANIVDFYKE